MEEIRFRGCFLGLALGDALGAPYEGGPLERLLWRVLGATRSGAIRWTDDTQMSLDLAESLSDNGALVLDDVAKRFASRWIGIPSGQFRESGGKPGGARGRAWGGL